ncbi:type II and III secretion system protein, partial [bacterium]|nr:type II and III secretion system protein [bacterium]
PSRGDVESGSSGDGGSANIPAEPGVSTGSAAGIVTGGAADIGEGGGDNGGTIKLGEGVVACTLKQNVENGSSAPFSVQNLAVSYFTQRGTITLMGGSEAQQRMVEKFIRDNDIKQPQAYLELSIVELNEQGSKEFENIWSVTSKHWYATFDGQKSSAGRPYGGNWLNHTEYSWDGGRTDSDGVYHPGEPYPVYTDGRITGMNLPQQVSRQVWSVIPNVHVTYQMNYLIENGKARVLANPKLIITNGQESTIDLTQDYVEKVTSEFLSSTGAGVGAVGAVQRTYTIGEDKGIKIALTPFISPEGYVTVNVKPQYATEAGRIYATGETGASELQATLLSRRNLDIKNVRIKDGETLVIGGMIQEEDSKIVHKIPVLGDLPLIGAAFRSTSTQKSKAELVIMITPKIINDGEGSIADRL